MDTRAARGEFAIELQNGDKANVKAFTTYEFLPQPLGLAPGIAAPAGGYDYRSVLVGYNLGPTRRRGLANLSVIDPSRNAVLVSRAMGRSAGISAPTIRQPRIAC